MTCDTELWQRYDKGCDTLVGQSEGKCNHISLAIAWNTIVTKTIWDNFGGNMKKPTKKPNINNILYP